jgi:hypothetical protein
MVEPEYKFPLLFDGNVYIVHAWHFAQLSIADRLAYNMTEYTYLVKMNGKPEFKHFEVFIGEDMEWHTKSTFLVPQDLVDRIGHAIDRLSN